MKTSLTLHGCGIHVQCMYNVRVSECECGITTAAISLSIAITGTTHGTALVYHQQESLDTQKINSITESAHVAIHAGCG